MKARLSDAFVKALEPSTTKGKTRVWDTAQNGFGVYVTETGKKAFFIRYKSGSRWRQATVCQVGMMPTHEARAKAAEMLNAATRGLDPLEEKARVSTIPTIAEFWPAYEEHAKARWKPRTAAENARIFEKHIKPALGSRKLDDVRRGDVAALHRSMKDTPGSANFTLRLFKAMVSAAIEWEYISSNPAVGVKPYPERKRERFLHAEELQRLFNAIAEEERLGGLPSVARPAGESLKDIEAALVASGKPIKRRKDGSIDRRQLKEAEGRGISRHAAGLFRLLVYTGCRLREVMHAEWVRVDWDARFLELPDSKTGAKRIPLNQPAIDELKALWGIRSQDKWIIEGVKDGAAMVNATKPWQRVCERAGLEGLRIHDLRHSWASTAVASGLGLPIVGKALGHAQSRTTERYAHLASDPVLAAADAVGALIVDAVKRPAAKVESIQERAVDDE